MKIEFMMNLYYSEPRSIRWREEGIELSAQNLSLVQIRS